MIAKNKLIQIPDIEYHNKNDGCVNSTLLKNLYSSSSRSAVNHTLDTKGSKFGSMTHKFILEPHEFYDEYVLRPEMYCGPIKILKEGTKSTYEMSDYNGHEDWNMKKTYHREAVKHLEIETGKKVAIQEEMFTLFDIQDRLEESQDYFTSDENKKLGIRTGYMDEGKAEHALYCDIDGITFKIKMDWLTNFNGKAYIVDLKSCISAHPNEVAKSICKYNYDLQGYFYKKVLTWYLRNVLKSNVEVKFVFLFAEKEGCHEIGFYSLTEEMELNGQHKFNKALEHYNLTIRQGKTYGYKAGYKTVTNLALPAWGIVYEKELAAPLTSRRVA